VSLLKQIDSKSADISLLKALKRSFTLMELIDFYFNIQLDVSLMSLLSKGEVTLCFHLCVDRKLEWHA
jgi:hypothetical protein